jgi:predicted SnoaL-like aldol condensation-catalyzing enzyme
MAVDRKTFLLQAAAATALTGPATIAAQAPDLHRRFEDFCDLFYRRKRVREAFEAHVAPDYIQHSAGMGQGREAAIQALEPMFGRVNFTVTPVRTIWDGSLATVILDVRVGEEVRAIVIDLYRHDRDRIVEHWDVKSEIEPVRRDRYFDGLSPR